ncbi:hypothetical protein AB0O91_12145 [Kitasatospora sp. NPDC089797]|uniref:hypothetical protein n=1 Tax=Kitasatospora sp. NPDC089797 TaxID=3155298 RepID=UPI00342F7102
MTPRLWCGAPHVIHDRGFQVRFSSALTKVAAVPAAAMAIVGVISPQAPAASATGSSSAPGPDAVQLPAGATPENWTIDRRAAVSVLPAPGPTTGATSSEGPAGTRMDVYQEVRNVVKHEKALCGADPVDTVTGRGPMTLTLTQTRSVATQWSATAGITAGTVSAGVGFNVTETVTNAEGGSYPVPDGKFGHLEAHPLFDQYTFDVYDRRVGGGAYIGSGQISHPAGFCYNHWTD